MYFSIIAVSSQESWCGDGAASVDRFIAKSVLLVQIVLCFFLQVLVILKYSCKTSTEVTLFVVPKGRFAVDSESTLGTVNRWSSDGTTENWQFWQSALLRAYRFFFGIFVLTRGAVGVMRISLDTQL